MVSSYFFVPTKKQKITQDFATSVAAAWALKQAVVGAEKTHGFLEVSVSTLGISW